MASKTNCVRIEVGSSLDPVRGVIGEKLPFLILQGFIHFAGFREATLESPAKAIARCFRVRSRLALGLGFSRVLDQANLDRLKKIAGANERAQGIGRIQRYPNRVHHEWFVFLDQDENGSFVAATNEIDE